MTLSVSLTDKKAAKTAAIYLAITLFCIIFATVYEHYSHGVYSNFMVYMFLFPLVMGVLPYGAMGLTRLRAPGRISANLYNAGVAALTVGSCLHGVFDIYGTVSRLVPIYWAAGALLAATGLFFYAIRK